MCIKIKQSVVESKQRGREQGKCSKLVKQV